jgi:hypothetical protein
MDATAGTPSGAASQAQHAVTQNVVAAATEVIACRDFRYMGP